MPNDHPLALSAPLAPATHVVAEETCDYCNSPRLVWRKCKMVCLNCGQIVKSCADL